MNKSLIEVWGGEIPTLGSGSNFTVFLDHLRIASIQFEFYEDYGVYHCIYDSFYWMEHFGDPNFKYIKVVLSHLSSYILQTAALFWRILTIQLTDTPILPFNYR